MERSGSKAKLQAEKEAPAAAAEEQQPSSLKSLFISFVGINVFYSIYGLLQEQMVRADPRAGGKKFDNTLFLFAIQCFMNASFALVARRFVSVGGGGGGKKSKPLSSKPTSVRGLTSGYMWLGVVSFTYLAAMLSSNEALKYVSFPIQALFKSCKIVPVMLGNVLVGVKYKPHDYVIVLMITLGIALTQYKPGGGGGGAHGATGAGLEASWAGIALLFVSLAFDGITGSNQHLLDKEFALSAHDLMFGMNAFAFAYTLVALVFTGELHRGLAYVTAHPWIQTDIFLFGLSSALGQNFIFYTITGPGPLACTTITTTRKFFTILLSVLRYPETNSLSGQQWMGVLTVFSALGMEIVYKARGRKPKTKDDDGDDRAKKVQ